MTTKELILALAEHVHVFGDDDVFIDRPGNGGFRVTGVDHTGMLTVVAVIEDQTGELRDATDEEAFTEDLQRLVTVAERQAAADGDPASR
jgi:hypothetical protein